MSCLRRQAAVRIKDLEISVEVQHTEHLKRTCCFIPVFSTSESITVWFKCVWLMSRHGWNNMVEKKKIYIYGQLGGESRAGLQCIWPGGYDGYYGAVEEHDISDSCFSLTVLVVTCIFSGTVQQRWRKCKQTRRCAFQWHSVYIMLMEGPCMPSIPGEFYGKNSKDGIQLNNY